MHPVRSGTAEIRARPTCTDAPRYYYLCMCGKSSATHLLHAVFPLNRQPGREAPLPHGSPATSSRQRRSNHPKREMMREGWGGFIHATCCWYTTEAPPNPLPLCWTVHAPGGLLSRAVLRQRVPAGRCSFWAVNGTLLLPLLLLESGWR